MIDRTGPIYGGESVPAERCSCGEPIHEDAPKTCFTCYGKFCTNCLWECDACGDKVCLDCVEFCPICHKPLCNGHYAEHVRECEANTEARKIDEAYEKSRWGRFKHVG